jgi:predicted PurR-regulated permease PerM
MAEGHMTEEELKQESKQLARESKREKAVFVQRVLSIVVIVFSVLLVLLLIYNLRQILLLLFAGVLAAIFFRSLSSFLRDKTGLPDGASLAIVLFLLAFLTCGLGWYIAPNIANQAEQLQETLPRAVEELQSDLRQYAWGAQLLDYIEEADPLGTADTGEIIARARIVVGGLFGGLIGLLIVLFIGIYLAASPTMYREGFIRLVPLERRKRARDVVAACVVTLKRWLIGRILLMIVIGLITGLGLWALDVPLALVLAILAAILEFIPNIGPILAAIPALLIAWTESPQLALYVFLLYFVIQQVESFVLTPLVFRETVKLPPVLTILALIGFGLILGPLGVLLATPMMAVGLVLLKKLYVEDALGDHTDNPLLDDVSGDEEDEDDEDVPDKKQKIKNPLEAEDSQ